MLPLYIMYLNGVSRGVYLLTGVVCLTVETARSPLWGKGGERKRDGCCAFTGQQCLGCPNSQNRYATPMGKRCRLSMRQRDECLTLFLRGKRRSVRLSV